MSKFTYQDILNGRKLEDYEWDDTWIDHPCDNMKRKLLYIGDSISCALRIRLPKVSGGKIGCDGFGTSKALDNPFFYDALRLFFAQCNGWEAVLFNNGLHGWHLSCEEYKHYYEKMIKFLISELKGVPIYVVLTTDAQTRREIIEKRNEAAREIAKKYSLKVIDLYEASLGRSELHPQDDEVHFTEEGYQLLAKGIIDEILKK